jgi:hypothetical protein
VVGVSQSVSDAEIGMNPYTRNMKHRDGGVAVECVWFSLKRNTEKLILFLPPIWDEIAPIWAVVSVHWGVVSSRISQESMESLSFANALKRHRSFR